MALERHALLLNRADTRERKYLESTAVGQNRLVPVHEVVQAARLLHEVFAGAQVQVVGVRQQNLRADFLHLAGRHGFHARCRANRHVNRRLNVAVRRVQHAQPRAGLLANVLEFIEKRLCHGSIPPLSGMSGFKIASAELLKRMAISVSSSA